ncbi:endonuclease/exonuclease/phosphatase family protein [Bdellovibrio sp. HCB2-146]|uniref:endonuclease/exonuclease/phosphatase family protein n=1 Tax=Bdellovibrio sp. HCB2-146 TaxID=3394362 RepID=UPI0039BCCE60
MKIFLPVQKLVTALLISVSLIGCAVSFEKKKWDLPPKADDEISVMSFNVENLFDTVHDADREDYAYMPVAVKNASPEIQKACREKNDNAYRRGECLNNDWTEEKLAKKMRNLTDVVLGVDGKGPDVLMLIEVENLNVLNIWNNDYLQKAGYKTVVLIEGPDKRGIDVGFMSRFPVVGKPVLHQIPWEPKNEEDKEWMFRSRNILEVTVKAPNGDPLTLFVAHFPSQSNPTYWREQASRFLAKLVADKGPDAMVVAAGDLNITHEEEEKEHFFRDIMGKSGAISHFVGCKECKGTHNYRGSWSYLDAQIYSKALLSDGSGSYKMEPGTIDVIRYNPIHLKKGKYPNRWDSDKETGVSDHFPLYVRLKQRSAAKNPVKDEAPAKAEKPAKKKKK